MANGIGVVSISVETYIVFRYVLATRMMVKYESLTDPPFGAVPLVTRPNCVHFFLTQPLLYL